MKKLTKSQEKRLYVKLSMDDLLHAKYEAMLREIRREYKHLITDRKRIRQVIGLRCDGSNVCLQVTEIAVTPYGTDVFVRL